MILIYKQYKVNKHVNNIQFFFFKFCPNPRRPTLKNNKFQLCTYMIIQFSLFFRILKIKKNDTRNINNK